MPRPPCNRTSIGPSRAILCAAALGALAAAASAQVTPIELTPTDVASTDPNRFSTLPTQDPSVFGLSGDVRGVNFDTRPDGSAIPSGTHLTNEYASIGVLMNSIRVSNNVFGGPASPPNATLHDQGQVYTFTVPVAAAGIINTSPDRDFIEFWSGPDRTGTLLLRFRDQEDMGGPNFNIDRFLGGRVAKPGVTIGSMWLGNASGNLELDEMIFEIAPPVCPADINLDGAVDSNDFFAFLTAYFNNDADFNGDGPTNSDDYFAFLTAFFTPGPGCL